MTAETYIHPFTPVFIKLLKAPVEYLDKPGWERLLTYKEELSMFLSPLGLSLVLDEVDGYAYLKHAMADEEEDGIVWLQRRPYTYEESVMLVLLRELMAEFESSEAITRELIRKRRELKEYVELFFKEKISRVRFLRDLDRLIDKLADHGFLDLAEDHEIPDEQRFRVKKIIKARVGPEELDRFYQQLRSALPEGAGNTLPD